MTRAIFRKRAQNEKKFTRWEILPQGGRRYILEIAGRAGWKACYVKEVDTEEQTVRFYQEIYNEKGQMVELHEKYPVDKGHQKIRKGESWSSPKKR